MSTAQQEISTTLATMFDQWNREGIALYRWTHDTPRENVAGCTSQVFRRIGGAWLVINETSARVPK
jgi:hypothetical protein